MPKTSVAGKHEYLADLLPPFRRLRVPQRIWELRDDLPAYHASYVALAEALGCGLLTADRRLSHAPGLRCPVTVISR